VPLPHAGDEPGVLQRRGGIVDRARARDDDQAVVRAGDDGGHGAAPGPRRGGRRGRQGDDGGDRGRCDDDAQTGDPRVDQVGHVDVGRLLDAQPPLDPGQQLRERVVDLGVHPGLDLDQRIGDPRSDVQDLVSGNGNSSSGRVS
jgi:hypothetical protein